MYNVELPANLTDFAELLSRVLAGEEVILSQAGLPVARIVPLNQRPLPRISLLRPWEGGHCPLDIRQSNYSIPC